MQIIFCLYRQSEIYAREELDHSAKHGHLDPSF
jgi:hypothetical protein